MPFMAEYNLEPLGKRDPGKSFYDSHGRTQTEYRRE